MTCQELAKLIDLYLDQALDEDEVKVLEYHLQQCQHCLGHADFVRALRGLIHRVCKTWCDPTSISNLSLSTSLRYNKGMRKIKKMALILHPTDSPTGLFKAV